MKPLLQILFFSNLLVSTFNASGKQEQDPDNLNFLTIGGGYSPSGNQVSLEKNVQYLNRMLIKENLGDAPHSVYFADGDSDGRDLQYLDPKFKIPKINEYLARFVGSTKGIQINTEATNLIQMEHRSLRILQSGLIPKGKNCVTRRISCLSTSLGTADVAKRRNRTTQ